MKNLIAILLFTSAFAHGQTFNRGAGSKDLLLLVQEGITYVPSGNERTDKAYSEAFKKYWKLGALKFAAFKESSDTLTIDAGIMALPWLNNRGQHCLLIVHSRTLSRIHNLSVGPLGFDPVAVIYMDGFTGTDDEQSIMIFAPQAVKALHDGIAMIIDNDIKEGFSGPGPELAKLSYENAVALQRKTLLIPQGFEENINIRALEKKGVSHRFVSLEEYLALEEAEKRRYCLFYMSRHSQGYTEFAIFDLENDNLIYTKRINGQANKFSNDEINHVIRHWQ